MTLSFCHAIANVVGKTEVLSTGDYGLGLDWAKHSDISIYNLINSDNCIYYIQRERSSSGEVYSFVKYSKDGEKVWEKKTSINTHVSFQMYDSKNGYILVSITLNPFEGEDPPYYVSYDENIISKQNLAKRENLYYNNILIKISKKDGSFIDCHEICWFDMLQLTDDNSIYVHSFIDERFHGLDTINLKTNIRTHGGYDTYIAKINPDYTLAWDFAIGGERHDKSNTPDEYYYEYWGESTPPQSSLPNWFYVLGDTLVLKASIFSDGVDIDPDPNKETKLDIMWNNDAVVAKYLLKGDKMPELIEYYYNWTPYLAHNVLFGDNGHIYSLNHPVIDEDYPLFYAKNRYEYREVNSDFTTYKINDYAHDIRSSFGSSSFGIQRIDKEGNLYVPYCRRDEDTTDVQLNDSIFLHIDDNIEIGRAIVKFDSIGNLRWSIHWPYAFWAENYTYDNAGGLYMWGTGLRGYTKADSDLDPDPEKSHIIKNPNCLLMRYVETYRIKSAPAEHGKIITPEKLVRWGNSAEVSVVPDAGYEAEKVTTSRGEELTKNASGKYVVENVTDVVTVSATFKISSAVDDINSDKIKIYPNPVEDILTIEGNEFLSKITILDVQGREIMTINDPKAEINVSHLASGVYTLKAESGNENFVKQFIKK